MKKLQLLKMSIDKPKHYTNPANNDEYTNCPYQKAPNLVWVNDFTYIKTGDKWYYLWVIMNLFS